jgi:P27 family predicted phage terminase small subunit
MKHTTTPHTPPSLDDHGTRIWEKWIEQVTDLELLENYCIAYQTMIQAAQSVSKDGLTIESASDRGHIVTRKNPACEILATSQRTLLACSRKLNLKTDPPEDDPFAEFTDPNWRKNYSE